MMVVSFIVISLLVTFATIGTSQTTPKFDVYIFHLIDNLLWGEIDGSGLEGVFPCKSSHIINHCEIFSSYKENVSDSGDDNRSLLQI
jgi:hypothetical protein